MMTLSAIMIDVSRVNLAKSMVSSSGDLAMNAALANYDTVVKDVYGLFAMSQLDDNPEVALRENVHNYFVNTLVTNNIMSTIEADDFINGLLPGFFETSTPDFSDFLAMDLLDFDAKPVENSSLANPYILKKQIVEYMKFRGPIKITTGFIDGLEAFSKLSHQTDVIEKKLEVDDALMELHSVNQELYELCLEFDALRAKYDAGVIKTLLEGLPGKIEGVDQADDQIKKVLQYGAPEKPTVASSASVSGDYDSLLSKIIDYAAQVEANVNLNFDQNSYEAQVNYLRDYNQASVDAKIKEAEACLDEFFNVFYEMSEEEQEGIDINDDYSSASAKIQDMIAYRTLADSIYPTAQSTHQVAQSKVKSVYTDLNQLTIHTSNVSKIIKKAEAIEKKEGEIAKKLADLEKSNKNFKESIEKYENETSATNSSDQFSRAMSNDHQYKGQQLDTVALEKLVARATDNKNYFNEVKKKIDAINYREKGIFDGEGKSKITNEKDMIDWFKANESAQEIVSGFSGVTDVNGIDKALKMSDGPSLTYFDYLKRTFRTVELSDDKDEHKRISENIGKDSAEGKKNAVENTGKNKAEKKTFDIKQPELPSVAWVRIGKETLEAGLSDDISVENDFKSKEVTPSQSFKSQGQIAKDIGEAVSNVTLASRDNLYVMEYVFHNFTHGAMEEDHGMKTFSHYPISKESNYFYGEEVEYILYGKTQKGANHQIAKTQVFGLRLVFNGIYAFTNPEMRTQTFISASKISLATGGFAPVPVVQAILQLSLAMGESVIDMSTLNDAGQVVLYKSPDTWALSMKGLARKAGKEVKEFAGNQIENATDNLTNFLIRMKDQSKKEIEDNLSRIQDEVVLVINSKVKEVSFSLLDTFVLQLHQELDKLFYTQSGELIDSGAIENYNEQILQTIDEVAESIFKDFELPGLDHKVILEGILNPVKSDLENWLIQRPVNTSESLNDIIDGLYFELDQIIESASNDFEGSFNRLIARLEFDFNQRLDNLISEAGESIGDELVSMTTSFLDETFGNLENHLPVGDGSFSSKSNKSALNQILSFSYEDYIRVFFFLKMAADEETTLLRIGDLIQTNLNYGALRDNDHPFPSHQKAEAAEATLGFDLSKAYTLLTLEAELQVQPLLLDFAFFRDFLNGISDAEEGDDIKAIGNIQYKGLNGY